MTLATKFGPAYEAVRAAARFKTIKVQLNDIEHELKVRVPVKREMEDMLKGISSPAQKKVNEIFESLAGTLKETINQSDDEFLKVLNADSEKIRLTDDDVIVNGTSVKQIATMTAIWHEQVERYFGLLQSATGEPVTESYEEIAEEFPEQVIREIIQKIDKAIRPTYEETKKN